MRIFLAAALAFPTAVLAAGGDDSPPKKPAVFCTGSQVYDKESGECVDPKNSSLSQDQIYLAARQLSYAGRYRDAQGVLNALPENDPGRLTYMGFTHRKLGNQQLSMAFYLEAIERDPTNILARSYMGQGLVDEGKTAQAIVQLHQIRAHGGRGTWSETSLQEAISTGTTYNY
ncbi:MAG: hypothetical protein ABJL72_16445 [Roseobacter sp.]